MKRIIALAIVVALILGLCFTGVTALADDDKGKSKNAQGPGGTRMVELAEDFYLELGKDNQYKSKWLDVKRFRQFKLYAHLVPDDIETADEEDIKFIVFESPVGGGDMGPWGVVGINVDIEVFPHPNDPEHWGAIIKFAGLYSDIQVKVKNDEEGVPVTMSLYLLMTDTYPTVRIMP